MKKSLSILVILSLFLIPRAHAQLEKGNVLVGGDIANFDIGLRKNTGYNFQIDPKAAWFIKNNIAVGPFINLGIAKFSKESPTETNYGVGALGRYYFGTDKVNTEAFLKHTRVFGEAYVGIQGTNESNGGGSTNGLGLGFGPGIAYFITPSIGFETLLEYQGLLGFGDLGTQSDLVLNIGFQIYLPGRATQNKVMNDVK